MRGRLSSLFRLFTILLLALSIWTAYANVFSDDADVRELAAKTARDHAGCRDTCKVTGVHGSRGMLEERLAYDIDKVGGGGVLVVCRRAYVVAGAYACAASSP